MSDRHNDWRDRVRWDRFFWPGVIVVYAFAAYILTWIVLAAHAEVPWTNPGSNPFRGTLEEAVEELADAGAPRADLDELAGLYRAGRCVRRTIQPGERIDLMTFGDGVLVDVIAVTPEPTIDCEGAFGAHFLRPLACGNFSYEAPEWTSYAPTTGWFGGPGGTMAWWPEEFGPAGLVGTVFGGFGSPFGIGSFGSISAVELAGGSSGPGSVGGPSESVGSAGGSSGGGSSSGGSSSGGSVSGSSVGGSASAEENLNSGSSASSTTTNSESVTSSVHEPGSLSLVALPLIVIMLWRRR